MRQLIDISISGAQIVGLAPGPKDGAVTFRIGDCVVEARIARVSRASFAVSFDGSLGVRTAMIRYFYSGQYVKAIDDVHVASLTKAVARRLFQ